MFGIMALGRQLEYGCDPSARWRWSRGRRARESKAFMEGQLIPDIDISSPVRWPTVSHRPAKPLAQPIKPDGQYHASYTPVESSTQICKPQTGRVLQGVGKRSW
ncbi:hypothetical protein CC2G_006582 [Coprinopsis cinerea AmutBmut pab1-1]|nr:hypothetical protein CC2G_006582 [Coprinopsis cinerea AmutBmut pab1-1]